MDFAKQCLDTSLKIIASPTPATFSAEAGKGNKRFSGIVVWLVLFAIYVSIMVTIGTENLLVAPVIAITLSIFIPATVILAVSAANLVYQKVFHHNKYIYDKILYISTAIIVSIQVIALPAILLIPESFKDFLGYAVWVYQFALLSVAFKSISGLKYWQSFITTIIAVFAGIGIWLCLGPFLFSMMSGVASVF
ncbi:MAG: hypothetical protein QY328_03395 [Anaerolineales bacterium]|nr:hypothetical protein [Anaerolineales bacterium]WKZ41081.1 MAG: hypothetical protein QY328_03395 [Anaerolineales bacterium]